MSQELKLSVVVACYKTEEFFERCLKSLFESEYKNLEILLIDDGSPDNCPKLCDEYAKLDERIRVVHKENGGGFSAKNLGIEIATGDYFAICDNDDMVPPRGYLSLMEKAMETDADVVHGVVRKTNVNTQEVKLWKRSPEDSLKTKSIGFQGAIYRTKMLKDNNIRLQPYRLGDDMSFVAQVYNYAENIQFVDEITYEYLIRPQNSAGVSAIQMKDFVHYYDEFRWRCWTLEYINKSEKLMQLYGKQLGEYCMIIDEQWLSFDQEKRQKCFEQLKRMVVCVNWKEDPENIKGYIQMDLDRFLGMDEAAYTSYLKKELKLYRPIKKLVKRVLGK